MRFIIFLTPIFCDGSNRLWRQRLLPSQCSLWRHKQTLVSVIRPLAGGKCRTFRRVTERYRFNGYLCYHCVFCVRVFCILGMGITIQCGIHYITTIRRIKFGPPIKLWRGSWFHVESWPQVLILSRIVTPSHDSSLNCGLGWGLQFNVEFWPGFWFHIQFRSQVLFLRWIVTPSHDSTLKLDLALISHFNVEIWPVVTIQREILPVELRLKRVWNIQQRYQNSIAKEGHNSKKNPLNIDPWPVWITPHSRSPPPQMIYYIVELPPGGCFTI